MQQILRLPHYTASDSSTRFVLLMRTDGHKHLKPAISVLSTKISKLKFCRYSVPTQHIILYAYVR